jgi:hypothetical protein
LTYDCSKLNKNFGPQHLADVIATHKEEILSKLTGSSGLPAPARSRDLLTGVPGANTDPSSADARLPFSHAGEEAPRPASLVVSLAG